MSFAAVLRQYFALLVKLLPMEDATFTSALFSADLFPGNMMSIIDALPTRADKAKYFLTHKISVDVSAGKLNSFNELIKVMEGWDDENVTTLAEEIKASLMKAAPANCDKSSDERPHHKQTTNMQPSNESHGANPISKSTTNTPELSSFSNFSADSTVINVIPTDSSIFLNIKNTSSSGMQIKLPKSGKGIDKYSKLKVKYVKSSDVSGDEVSQWQRNFCKKLGVKPHVISPSSMNEFFELIKNLSVYKVLNIDPLYIFKKHDAFSCLIISVETYTNTSSVLLNMMRPSIPKVTELVCVVKPNRASPLLRENATFHSQLQSVNRLLDLHIPPERAEQHRTYQECSLTSALNKYENTLHFQMFSYYSEQIKFELSVAVPSIFTKSSTSADGQPPSILLKLLKSNELFMEASIEMKISDVSGDEIIQWYINFCIQDGVKVFVTSPSSMDKIIKDQDLQKQLHHFRKKCEAATEENRRLKKNVEVSSLEVMKLTKWVTEKDSLIAEYSAKLSQAEVDIQQARDKKDIFSSVEIAKFEDLLKLHIEDELPVKSDDVLKTVAHPQCLADDAQHMKESKQQLLQTQQLEEMSDLESRLVIIEKENAKLKKDLKLLSKRRLKSKDKLPEPEIIQHGLSLGSGIYGEVYKVHYKDKHHAQKVLHHKLLPGYPNVPKTDINKLVEQFTLKYSKFSHPNVEQFVEIVHFRDNGISVILTELLTENLTDYIGRTKESLHYDLQLSLCNDMAQGIEYLHSQQLVHGNLHAANVLMSHDHHAKIADYLCPILLSNVSTLNRSSNYIAPEVTEEKPAIVQSNVFTLAVLFLEVITKHPPRLNTSVDAHVTLSELEKRSGDLQDATKNHLLLPLIEKCLSNDDVARPLIKEVCERIARLIKDKDSPQTMAFKLMHTTEFPLVVPALASGKQLNHVSCQNLQVAMHWAFAVTIGTMAYITGGNSRTGNALEHVYRYDLENNSWDKLPPSGYHYGVPVALEGKLSLVGGRVPSNKDVISKIDTFDEDNNQWVKIYPDMKQKRFRPAVVANDTHVVVLGGKTKEESVLTDTAEVMNIQNKQWTMLATRLPCKMYDISATISNDLVWIIGYDNGKNRSNKIYTVRLDDLIFLTTVSHSWKQVRNDVVCFKTSVIGNSYPPIILGGYDCYNKVVAEVVAFDPKNESWSEVATLSSPRANCAVVNLPGERGILVFGGCTETKALVQSNSTCLKTVELYYISNAYIS